MTTNDGLMLGAGRDLQDLVTPVLHETSYRKAKGCERRLAASGLPKHNKNTLRAIGQNTL
jgi:hypothetical protein